MSQLFSLSFCVLLPFAFVACAAPQREEGCDAAFARVAGMILQDNFARHPSAATDLGIHKYDDRLEDFSREARIDESTQLKAFRTELASFAGLRLSPARQLDLEQLLHALDSSILAIDTIHAWTRDPDSYSGGITNAAYAIMKRPFASGPQRLESLIARETVMPAALAQARKNLDNPPRIYTEIAIEQIDGNISFFKNDVPAAFEEVKDAPLLARFSKSNAAVIAALGEYKAFLESDVLPLSPSSALRISGIGNGPSAMNASWNFCRL